jgi:hypothetical protein
LIAERFRAATPQNRQLAILKHNAHFRCGRKMRKNRHSSLEWHNKTIR